MRATLAALLAIACLATVLPLAAAQPGGPGVCGVWVPDARSTVDAFCTSREGYSCVVWTAQNGCLRFPQVIA